MAGERAYLVLKSQKGDFHVFEGISFGAAIPKDGILGEVVFNTGMTGYQEILTDPSYCGQFVTFTFPHIGNTGVNSEDLESRGVWCSGVIVHELNRAPSNHRSEQTLEGWLKAKGVSGIEQVDTRALT